MMQDLPTFVSPTDISCVITILPLVKFDSLTCSNCESIIKGSRVLKNRKNNPKQLRTYKDIYKKFVSVSNVYTTFIILLLAMEF